MASSISYRRKCALIIGINKYPRNPLQYCINDAADLKTALECISFNVVLEKNCNLSEFYETVDEFAKTIQRDDLVFFYFAGHGKQVEDQNYLLPSDYNYDYRGHERDHIPNYAINVQYIMQKLDDRKCRITIYLFDCCRQLVKTRATSEKQGLLAMNAPLQSLIVYACAPGKAVQDETRNNRNGSFIENLLKHIATPNRDIEEIFKTVAREVNKQTDGFQLPYRTSSLMDNVYLSTTRNQERSSTAWLKAILSQLTHSDTSATDINILLLGESGVGKRTFINAFANYLVYDTFNAAFQQDMQVVVPSAFCYIDRETFEEFEIAIGNRHDNEQYHTLNTTHIQSCRSYNFTIGNRLLRLIDAPSIGDPAGLIREMKNMEHVFTYISRYKHLNGVCILVKPNQRRDHNFTYCIKELLTHLNIDAIKNIAWVFTHGRIDQYMPGTVLTLLRLVFSEISRTDYRFSSSNCFLFENEPIRILAATKCHHRIEDHILSTGTRDWDISTEALFYLMSRIISCKPHPIRGTFFLNIVRQLTYKLIGFINDKISSELSVTTLNTDTSENPETVLIGRVCTHLTQFIKMNSIVPFNNTIYPYFYHFRDIWGKLGVNCEYIQDYKRNSIILGLDNAITELNTLFCGDLQLRIENHQAISDFLENNSITPLRKYLVEYIWNTFKTKLNEPTSISQFLQYNKESLNSSSDKQPIKYFHSIFYKEFIKQTTSVEYLQFLKKNSIIPLSNDTINHICQIIFEDITWNPDHFNSNKLISTNTGELTASIDFNKIDQSKQIEDILKSLEEICALPINGIHIRQYMEDLEKAQKDIGEQKEHTVHLPPSAQSSSMMQKLRAIIEQN